MPSADNYFLFGVELNGVASLGREGRRRSSTSEEFLYVLRGALNIALEGHGHVLHPGDGIYFESTSGAILERRRQSFL
jgi:uncharacterized cupin superfamily protein